MICHKNETFLKKSRGTRWNKHQWISRPVSFCEPFLAVCLRVEPFFSMFGTWHSVSYTVQYRFVRVCVWIFVCVPRTKNMCFIWGLSREVAECQQIGSRSAHLWWFPLLFLLLFLVNDPKPLPFPPQPFRMITPAVAGRTVHYNN